MERPKFTKKDKEFLKKYQELCKEYNLQFFATCFEDLALMSYSDSSFNENISGLLENK